MSAPLVSPPISDSGAFASPRTLQKWLDINPVSALTRTSRFIVLPQFTVPYTWLGYSDIIVSYNFEASHNFSLTDVTVNPDLNTLPNGTGGSSDGEGIGADTGGGLS